MENNRSLFLAILLSLVVVVAWQWLMPSAPPRPAAPVPPVGEGAQTTPGKGGGGTGGPAGATAPGEGSRAATAGGSRAGAAGAAGEGGAVSEAGGVRPGGGPPVGGEREERVVLASGSVRAIFSNRGAQLLSLTVLEPSQKNERQEMVRERSDGPYPYALIGKDLKALPIDSALFAVERSADGHAATFRYRGPAGSSEKHFRLDPRGLLEADVRMGGAGWGVMLGPGVRNPTAQELANRYIQSGAVYKRGAEVQVLVPKGESEIKEVPGAGLRFAGLEDTYFLAAAVPRSTLARVAFEPVLAQPGERGTRFLPVPPKDQMTADQKDLNREYLVSLEPAGDSVSLLSYWGGKSYEQLKAVGLEETVQLGRFGFIVLPLLASLHWIYDHVVPNYGWAIILLTILIKILLLPLTHHSTMSMRKMQALNPKMQAIRERYRPKLKDKQGRPNLEMQRKMNEEVMALYKSEGVNPAGGCLPLLLQMPILYAFYQLLSISVDLRHAPWMLWIHDLSAADPYYLLPIIMGITQFLQVYLAPQSGDPSQRRLFLIMPVVMVAFFFGAPSGLVLYWLTNNILTIAQQWVYNRLWKQPA